jgi:cyclophilin family peptidyl-prolyl cis-trans isomerase
MRKLLFILALTVLPSICTWAQNDKREEVVLETTMGNIRIKLYNETPRHRDNFIKKVTDGFYDGVLFHRVIRNFMIQSGDPNSKNATKGSLLGDSETQDSIPPEFRIPEIFHKRGAVAMAREGDSVNPARNSSSEQFYIVWGQQQTDMSLQRTQARLDDKTNGQVKIDSTMAKVYKEIGGTPHLDGQYTVFGEVVDGMDVVDKIQNVPVDANDRPTEDVRIIKATLVKE